MRKLFPRASRIGDVAVAVLLAILLSLFVTANATAQQRQPPPCAPYPQWKAELERVGQKLIGVGTIGETHAVLFWSTVGGDFWTVLSVEATTRRACVIAAGQEWDQGRIPAHGERSA